MSNSGYIKVSRNVLKLPIWNNSGDLMLWLYCALRVSHCEYRSLKPGQYGSSKKQISQDLHWSRNTLKEHLDRLQANGIIDVCTYYGGVIVTLNNWENTIYHQTYLDDQDDCTLDDIESSITDTDDDQFLTGDAQYLTPTAQKVTVKSSKIDHIQEHIQEQDNKHTLNNDRARDFERWWLAYPRHGNKSAAKLAFMELDVPVDQLMAALSVAKASQQWQTSNGRYIPNAAKWLDGAWQDYLPAKMSNDSQEENPVWTTY